jgi:hypothetical protein
MIPSAHVTSVSREAWRALVAALQRQHAVLQRQVADVTARHEAVRAAIAQLTRAAQRQAAPCSQGHALRAAG